MTGLDVHRDEGPLTWLPGLGRGRLPEVTLLLASLALVASSGILAATGVSVEVAPRWIVAAAWLLAVLARRGRPLTRLAWPVPALLRGIEYGSVLLLLGDDPWAYAYLVTLAFHHYDIVYRTGLRGEGPPPWLRIAIGGWVLRLLALVVASLLDQAHGVAVVLTVYLAPLLVAESVTVWWPERRATRQ